MEVKGSQGLETLKENSMEKDSRQTVPGASGGRADEIRLPVNDCAESQITPHPFAQIAAAVVLAFPTALAGHALGFGMSQIGENAHSIPLSWFLYAMGEGIAASICFAFFLSRFRASLATRVWSGLAVSVFLVLALPSLDVLFLQYFHSESVHLVLIGVLFAAAAIFWFAWLPWWKPSWVIRDHENTDREY